MSLKRTFLSTILLFLLSSPLFCEDIFKANYSFSNLSINYLDWTDKTEKDSPQKDFPYLEFEGGAGFNWGEVYMFLDIENPTEGWDDEPADNLRVAFKPVIDISLAQNIFLHIQDYTLQSKDFYVHNLVVGLSYKITTDFGLWIKPFVGPHYQDSTFYSGYNGIIAGWVFDYRFDISKNSFSIAQWHECALARDDKDGYDDNIGRQGALSFWWHPVEEISTGFQYRYASYNLGSSEYQDGIIYSLKYNF